MQEAIATLRREHELILAAVGTLEHIAEAVGTGGTLDAVDSSRVLAFLRELADANHHGKEEGFLFPAMVAAGVPHRGGPVGVMLAEHEQGREAVRAMDAALRNGPDALAFAGAARSYAALLRAHITKENNVLFPMAERVVGPLEWHAMSQAFAEHEQRTLGGRRASLEAEIEEIAAKYPR